MKKMRPLLYLLPLLLLLTALATLPGCQTKARVQDFSDSAVSATKSAGQAAKTLGTKTGQLLGLVDKKVDYIELAFAQSETPASLKAGYTLEDEREIGRALASDVFKRFKRYAHPELDRYLNLLTASLCAVSERPGMPCCVAIVQLEQPRYFSLPGGYLIVSLGALRTCESESDLAALLAEGFAHIQLGHALERWERLQAAARRPGDIPNQEFSDLAETVSARLMQEGFTPAELKTGDRLATRLLTRLGYEPGGVKSRLEQEQLMLRKGTTGPLKDYEIYKERAAAVDAELEELHAQPGGRTNSDRFKRECFARLPAPL